MWFTLGAILVILATFVLPAFYVVPQWEKAAVVRFGNREDRGNRPTLQDPSNRLVDARGYQNTDHRLDGSTGHHKGQHKCHNRRRRLHADRRPGSPPHPPRMSF